MRLVTRRRQTIELGSPTPATPPGWSWTQAGYGFVDRCGTLVGLSLGDRDTGVTMTTAVSFEGLTLGYDSHPAVRRVQTEIHEGSLTAIVGPNGAGKSTLLKGVTGTLAPLEGRVEVGGTPGRDIAYLPQQMEIDRAFPISVVDLVAMGLWREIGAFGKLGRAKRSRVDAAIAAVGLTGFQRRAIGTLSGGQLQRALFARLLLQDASLVLLDEPFTAIDAKTTQDLLGIIHRWHGEGRTVIAVLHDHETVRAHFPQTLMLARELVAHGPTAQVMTAENQYRARQMCEACDSIPHQCGKSAA